MTEAEIISAIEQATGWTYDKETEQMVAIVDGNIVGWPWPSLDAMDAAWKLCCKTQKDKIIACNKLVNHCGWTESAIMAGVDERCEVLLKFKGLWK